jgi:hypothetical protein
MKFINILSQNLLHYFEVFTITNKIIFNLLSNIWQITVCQCSVCRVMHVTKCVWLPGGKKLGATFDIFFDVISYEY